MRVFLIHGMGRSPLSMAILATRLQRLGHEPSTFAYYVSRHDMKSIAKRFAAHVVANVSDGAPYAVVSHSLGGIITRLAAAEMPSHFERFVMLAPPNAPPAAARAFANNPVFKALTRDTGQRLADEDFYATLPTPSVPTLIYAGTAGPRSLWHAPERVVNDGVLSVDETRLAGCEHREVPAIHTFIMNHKAVVDGICAFLE